MRIVQPLFSLSISVSCIALADTEHEVYLKLAEGLQRQVQLLGSIVDAATAQDAIEPLERVVAELAALNKAMSERQLWNYLENTPDIKQPLLDTIEQLFLELRRLESEGCFGNKKLQGILAPMLTPAA